MQLKSKVFGLLVFLFLSNFSFAQKTEKVTLNGYIKEASSGETLIGASVYVFELETGTTTNEYGFYSLSLPLGSYKIEFSYLGFDSQIKEIEIMSKDECNFCEYSKKLCESLGLSFKETKIF